MRIVVINPNSTTEVTDGISAALEPLRVASGPTIECVTLDEGPPAIETDAHVAEVAEPLVERMQHEAVGGPVDAFVIACYSDPGIDLAREELDVPVYGIAESAMSTAIARGGRFGVVSLFEESVARHLRYLERLGLTHRQAADRPLGLGVLELAEAAPTRTRLRQVASRLRDDDGADVIILGCTGLAPYRAELERVVGVPVIDPTQAAVGLALAAALLG